MNQNFWDHLLNAAGFLIDANAREQEEREAAREARGQRKPKPKTATESTGFDANDPSCCVAKRRIKVAK